jgi:uncharacterized lipoprotein NlpE involved in copper resistance
MKIPFRILALLILLAFALVSCQKSQGSDGSSVVEDYFKALVAKDGNQAVSLSCSDWEEQAQLEADTFAINPATAENIQCKIEGEDGDASLVSCTGKLVLDYNGEKQEINLADRTYRVVQEGGEWRMCGYK